MLSTLFNLSSRRRRLFLIKICVISVVGLSILLFLRSSFVSHPSEELPRRRLALRAYQKADSPDAYNDIGNNVNNDDFFDETHREEEIEKRRKIVEVENIDEFLVPVLKNYKYVEVDLRSKTISAHPSDDYDDEIKEDRENVVKGLGERGEKGKVPDFQTAVAAQIEQKDAFNRLLSDMISPNRTVFDTREETCKSIKYDHILPTASVVIIYTNEAFSSLVRTLHSVINRSPPRLIQEIVLVDDFSDRRDLKGKLERYIATSFPLGKIRLIRLLSRSGLIRARMIGAHVALGDVLVFLDAHCETVDTWLEPLLQRIKEDRKAVVCPIIDVIDDKTMEYSHGNGAFFQIGGFTWSGHFTWINIPDYEMARKKSHHSPTRSPTMAGGLFAIERKYFWEVGSYDSDMQLWGGENLEMSFRVWQCGGSVEIVPCSRVGHIFRSFHPYTFPGNVDSHGLNTARLAEVWMDEYKDIFYSFRPELRSADFGDVSKRINFRNRLKCKSFTWYLDNIYREKFRLWIGSKAHGQFKNEATKRCLDNFSHKEGEEYTLNVYPCHPDLFSSQTFFISSDDTLRREGECAFFKSQEDKIQMMGCDDGTRKGDKWTYNAQTYQIVHMTSGKCMTVQSTPKDELFMSTCKNDSEYQRWKIDDFKKNRKT